MRILVTSFIQREKESQATLPPEIQNVLDNWKDGIDGVIDYANKEIERQELAEEVITNIQDYLVLAHQEIAGNIQIGLSDWQEVVRKSTKEEIKLFHREKGKVINQQAEKIVEKELSLPDGKLVGLVVDELIIWKKQGGQARSHRDNLLSQAKSINIHKDKSQVEELLNKLQELKETTTEIPQTIYQQKTTEIENISQTLHNYLSAYQSIEEILDLAQKAIVSKQIAQLEEAEKKLSSLLEEQNEEKKKIFSLYLRQIDEKLKEVIRQKSICQIEGEQAKASAIGENVEPDKKDWKEDISNTPIADLREKELEIKNDLLQQVIVSIITTVEKDLGVAQKIISVVKLTSPNWKEEVKNIPNVEKGQKLKDQFQAEILQKTRSNIIDFVNKKLTEYSLNSEQLNEPYCWFTTETEQKNLAELSQWQQALAVHLEEKRIQYGKSGKNMITSGSEWDKKWDYVLPLALVGGVGMLSSMLLRQRLKNQKKLISQNNNNSLLIHKAKVAFGNYYTNLRKAKKNGYNSQLFQEINKNLRVIGEITTQLEQELQAKKWKNIQKEYKKYKESKQFFA